MNKQDVLRDCTIEGNVVKLPNVMLDRKLYKEVEASLKLIGGQWKSGKIKGFVFSTDPTSLLKEISNNEVKVGKTESLQKQYQFFPTPDKLADKLVDLAEIDWNHEILEPSAGQGAIIKAIQRVLPVHTVWCYELMKTNHTFLDSIIGARRLGDDFLNECDTSFDRIIANPPFRKNQDIDHIRKMYDHLNPGGRLVTISSTHWEDSKNKKETEFRSWLYDLGAKIIKVDAGEFKESGTMISTFIIIIDKENVKNFL